MNRKLAAMATVAAAGLTLSACAEFTHLTRGRDLATNTSRPRATFIDAKQRAVISTRPEGEWKTDANGKQKFEAGKARVCAEPSPDALSALAASSGFSLAEGTSLGVNAAGSLAESAASIGLRTQSIQLMRDAMYRICEGYMSGALTDGSFETLHRRLQSSIVAILAIEQLTGAVKAQQVILTGSASTGSADAVLKLTEQTATARNAVAAAEKEVATATEAKAQAKTTEETATAAAKADAENEALAKAAKEAQDKLKEATDKLTAAQAKLKEAEEAFAAVDEARRAALSGTTTASADGKFMPVSDVKPLSAEATTKVAETIKAIVEATMGQRYSDELCATLMVGYAYDVDFGKGDAPAMLREKARNETFDTCNDLLRATESAIRVQTEEDKANAEAYRTAVGKLSSKEFLELVKLQLGAGGTSQAPAPVKPPPRVDPFFKATTRVRIMTPGN